MAIEIARQVTDRSPRMLSVASALTWPAFAIPTIIPNCCAPRGSDAVGSMRPYSSGGPWYLSRSGKMAEALTVCGRKAQRRHGANRAGRFGHRRAILRHERARDTVEGAHALDVVPDHGDAGRPTCSDGLVQLIDRRLVQTKRLILRDKLICHHHTYAIR